MIGWAFSLHELISILESHFGGVSQVTKPSAAAFRHEAICSRPPAPVSQEKPGNIRQDCFGIVSFQIRLSSMSF